MSFQIEVDQNQVELVHDRLNPPQDHEKDEDGEGEMPLTKKDKTEAKVFNLIIIKESSRKHHLMFTFTVTVKVMVAIAVTITVTASAKVTITVTVTATITVTLM